MGKTLLEKWHLDALLGEGGMGAVYAATHRNGARGAVKMLHPNADADEVSRFIREGYIANRVDHSGVVRALDDDIAEDGTPFLVMELLEGKALDELANQQGGRLPVREVLRVMREVLDALAAAHDQGIVHRDIKPENIFITVDGRVKLLDFGIAHLPEGSGPPSPKTRSDLVMGTPSFMSPEQARARWELVGPVSDVWAVGATMFTLLSGQYVHEEDTVPELLAAVFNNPARSLKEVAPTMARQVVALVDRALELRIVDRWGSAREMYSALLEVEAAIGQFDRRGTPSSLASTLPPLPLRTRRRSIALGALDLSSGILMLVLSAYCLSARASVPLPSVAAAARAVAIPDSPVSVGVPEEAAEVTAYAAQEPSSVAPVPGGPGGVPLAFVAVRSVGASRPTAMPSSAATNHVDGMGARRSIYDRRN